MRMALGVGAFALLTALSLQVSAQKPPREAYTKEIVPLLQRYCFACHSATVKKGGLDLQRFTSVAELRKDVKPWQGVIEQVQAGQMPPAGLPQPTAAEKRRLTVWVQAFLDSEARARANDPGDVPLRRLSNAEYDNTVRELTGIDFHPTREFPADGAAGEGFTNASEALTDISPVLLSKYLGAAKDVADHAVLLPDGFRFSTKKTRSDWTRESTERLQAFYARFAHGEGRLLPQPYLAATVTYREALRTGKVTLAQVAQQEKLNPKYLGILYQTLTGTAPSLPLESLRAQWRQATSADVPALTAALSAWQSALWKVDRVGSYLRMTEKGYAESTTRQSASDPKVAGEAPVRVALKPAPNQSEVVLYLRARDLSPTEGSPRVVWHQPRFEAAGKPTLLLRDYPRFGPTFEVDPATLFASAAAYLAAVSKQGSEVGLDPVLLQRWSEVLELGATDTGRVAPAAPLTLLDTKLTQDSFPGIKGWHQAGQELPAVLTNASNTELHIPGTAAPHSVIVHPSPQQFVGVTWKSPLVGRVRVAARITHAHPSCGNGVAWWLERRRGAQAALMAEGTLGLGKQVTVPTKTVLVEPGDQLLLAVDANAGDHTCDLTDIALTITEAESPTRHWDLAADIAERVLDGNPHADQQGNPETWSFVQGPSRPVGTTPPALIPSDSVLGRWREAAVDHARRAEAATLALAVQRLLSGARPTEGSAADRQLYDQLVTVESPLLLGVDTLRLGKPRPATAAYGLKPEAFLADGSLSVAPNTVVSVRLPAALLRQYTFVAEGRPEGPLGDRVVQFQAQATPPDPYLHPDSLTALVASPAGAGYHQLQQGLAAFRQVFPLFLCFPPVIPTDEVVSLKMFHREDDPLIRLFLDPAQAKELEALWTEHRLISRQPAAENDYLPQFIGFVTQDGGKEMLAFFEGQRPAFKKRADAFLKEEAAAIPKQLAALVRFMEQAYRRPCTEQEKAGLRGLYQAARQKGLAHDEAFRGALARLLVAPAFLFRIEHAPPGKAPGFISDTELAVRLSYFLWAAPPDTELRTLAASGRLHDPKVLEAQVARMLKDKRLRALAVEFGTQWVHVRGFDTLNEKSEKLFPTFDASLRSAIYEESILFFQDLFQSDRAVTDLLAADDTFLNETLAKHYGIPGITGSQWRRVKGVQKYGRGGLLGLASVQAKQAGASRTSPVLRGNWVFETLLGEKLPRPPANVPRLPEEEGGADRLTMRQLVEKHTRVPACSGCHQKIDPLGFALERYDPIGRLRTKDLGGLPLDARAKLLDGAQFEGINGLRHYLLTQKREVVTRVFCRRLLGYALGRSVTLSDTQLLNEMMTALNAHQGRLSAAVNTIVRSPQFRMIRGSEHER